MDATESVKAVESANERRRIIVVDRRYQLRDLAVWTVTAITFILAAVFFYYFLQRFYPDYQPDPRTLKLMVGTLVFIFLFALLMGLNSILRSHRVAGAAYRIETSIKRAREGDYQFTVILREGDYLVEVARSLNEFLLDLTERKRDAVETRAALEELLASGKLGAAEAEKLKTALAFLTRSLRQSA